MSGTVHPRYRMTVRCCPKRGADQGGTAEYFSPLTGVRGAFFIPAPGHENLTKEGISMKFSNKIQRCDLSPMRKFHAL